MSAFNKRTKSVNVGKQTQLDPGLTRFLLDEIPDADVRIGKLRLDPAQTQTSFNTKQNFATFKVRPES